MAGKRSGRRATGKGTEREAGCFARHQCYNIEDICYNVKCRWLSYTFVAHESIAFQFGSKVIWCPMPPPSARQPVSPTVYIRFGWNATLKRPGQTIPTSVISWLSDFCYISLAHLPVKETEREEKKIRQPSNSNCIFIKYCAYFFIHSRVAGRTSLVIARVFHSNSEKLL